MAYQMNYNDQCALLAIVGCSRFNVLALGLTKTAAGPCIQTKESPHLGRAGGLGQAATMNTTHKGRCQCWITARSTYGICSDKTISYGSHNSLREESSMKRNGLSVADPKSMKTRVAIMHCARKLG